MSDTSDKPDRALVLWVFTDDRAGHRTQLEGLITALQAQADIQIFWVPLERSLPKLLYDYLRGRYTEGAHLPAPDMLLAAGHQTHPSLLGAKHAVGGYAVVLMKPSLPLHLFDLVVAPHHDGLPASGRVFPTHGAINKIRWTHEHDSRSGVILIGGPSRSHGWHDDELVSHIETLLARDSDKDWYLTTSPRTPESFLQKIRHAKVGEINIVPYTETPPGWMADRLAQAAYVWVTEDSVSMVYEALSSGAAVGILSVPRIREGRVIRGLDALVSKRWVTTFEDWLSGADLKSPPGIFNEAERVATELLSRIGQQTTVA